MARKSRKPNKTLDLPMNISSTVSKIKYLAGIYVRLSVEDNGYKNGDSLQNQITFLVDYIENHCDDLQLINVYKDNGLTGTNFKREGWLRLIEDLKKERINCIVVKDFSRIGRNYIEVGNYLERIFPFLGVRVISVNEHFDSAKDSVQNDMLLNSLMNIVNEYYARDISKKVRQVKRVMQERGEYICTVVPYGYKKSDADRKKLCMDKESACVVKQIFAWRLQGKGCTVIANYLNALAIPSPGMYYYMNGNAGYKKSSQAKWKSKHVVKILTDLTYLGHTVQGKTRSSCFEQERKVQFLPQKEWVIVEHTHEALVTQDEFAAAKAMAERSKEKRREQMQMHEDIPHVDNPLRKKLFCGKCGGLLTRRSRVKEGIRQYSYFCSFSKQRLGVKCKQTEIPEDFLMKKLTRAVLERIGGRYGCVKGTEQGGDVENINPDVCIKNADQMIEKYEKGIKPEKHLEEQYLKKQVMNIGRKKKKIYAEMKENKISLDKYMEEKNDLEEQCRTYKKRLACVLKNSEENKMNEMGVRKDGTEIIKKNDDKNLLAVQEGEEIPFAVLERIIEKVYVSSREKIEIVYTYQTGF